MLFHPTEHIMCLVRLGPSKKIEEKFFNHRPNLTGFMQIIIHQKNIRVVFTPQTIFSAKRRNAAFNRNAGSRKSGYSICLPDDISSFFYHIHSFQK